MQTEDLAPTVSHRLFAVPELLRLIFIHLRYRPKDLLKTALVCSDWRNWALEVRWSQCTVALSDLLRLLGPVTRTWSTISVEVPETTEGEEIQLFLKTALRITDMNLGNRPLDSATIAYLRQLESTVGNRLFPALQKLHFRVEASSLETVSLFTGPSTSTPSLHFGPDVQGQNSPQINEGIQNLTIWMASDHLPSGFSNFPALRTLLYSRGRIYTDQWIEDVAACKQLTKLSIRDPEPNLPLRPVSTEDRRFPALKELSITAPHSQHSLVSRFLVYSNIPELTALELSFPAIDDDILEDALEIVERKSPGLQRIHLAVDFLTIDSISRLLRFSHLRDLFLVGSQSMDIDDEAIDVLARSMSKLTNLSLRWYPLFSPGVTTRSLESLATHATALKTLMFTVEASRWRTNCVCSVCTGDFSFKQLERLDLTIKIPYDQLNMYGQFLARVCPVLEVWKVDVWTERSFLLSQATLLRSFVDMIRSYGTAPEFLRYYVQAKLMQVDHGPRYFSTQPTVFAVPELLQLIFVELHDEEKDLLNAAVVCSAWKAWALETRWGHCRVELRHLLVLLGPVKLTHSDSGMESVILDITEIGPPDRFIQCARLVTHLDIGIRRLPNSNIEVLRVISQGVGDRLFPRMRSLKFGLNIDMVETVSFFTGPLISTPALRFEPTGTPNTPLSPHPLVQDLVVRMKPSFGISGVSNYPNLRTLHYAFGRVPCDWWIDDLNSCKKLTELILDNPFVVENSLVDPRDRWVFPQLGLLRILAPNVSDVLVPRIILNSDMPKLRTLGLLGPSVHPSTMDAMLGHLEKKSPLLERVDLELLLLTAEAIMPLLTFSNLQELRLIGSTGSVLDDATINIIARSIPRLSVLMLRWYPLTPNDITNTSLLSLAEYATSLVELTFTVSATGWWKPDVCLCTRCLTPVRFERLQMLDLTMEIHLPGIRPYGQYLARICPVLKDLRVDVCMLDMPGTETTEEVEEGFGKLDAEFCDAFWGMKKSYPDASMGDLIFISKRRECVDVRPAW